MNKKLKTHKDLILYKKSLVFVSEIYQITKEFPSEEKFGLISQLRRACVSVPTNIAEGSGRRSPKELRHFLFICLGSISEVETLLAISINLAYISKEDHSELENKLSELRKMTSSLINSISE